MLPPKPNGYIWHPFNDLTISLMTPSKYLSTALLTLCMLNAAAQSGGTDPVLMTVDGQPVTRGEFEAIYKKNNKEVVVTQQALDELSLIHI